MTHWKQLADNNYIGAYSFSDTVNEIEVTIKNVKRDEVTAPGGKKDYCIIVSFEETKVSGVDVKPMILNKTNCTAVEKALGTPFIEEWAGHKITIYKTTTKYQRDIVDCLRIKATPPKKVAIKCFCEVCGLEISKQMYDASVKKYGVALCSAQCKEEYDKKQEETKEETKELKNNEEIQGE